MSAPDYRFMPVNCATPLPVVCKRPAGLLDLTQQPTASGGGPELPEEERLALSTYLTPLATGFTSAGTVRACGLPAGCIAAAS